MRETTRSPNVADSLRLLAERPRLGLERWFSLYRPAPIGPQGLKGTVLTNDNPMTRNAGRTPQVLGAAHNYEVVGIRLFMPQAWPGDGTGLHSYTIHLEDRSQDLRRTRCHGLME